METRATGKRRGSVAVSQWRCATVLAVLWASCLQAADITWTNESGGDFSTAGNWSPNQVPASADAAYCTLDNVTGTPYTVTWSQDDITNECFRIRRGKVVLDLGGNTYVHNTGGDNSEIGTAGRADVVITNGTILAGGPVEFLYIYGDGTTVRVQNAYFESRYFTINASGAGSTLIVDGSGSTVHSWGYNTIGTSGRGSIIVTNGGTVVFQANISLGSGVSGYGKIVVSGTG